MSREGKKLPWLTTDEFQRVNNACWFFNHEGCQRIAEECLAIDGRAHDKLPPNLLEYVEAWRKASQQNTSPHW